MATVVSCNGSSFTVPGVGEEDWGGSSKVDGLLIELANSSLQKSGGTFALTAEVDFGGTAGIKALTYKSRGTNVSSTGVIRLASAEIIGWRNNANNADLELTTDASDNLTFNGNILSSSSGVIPADAGGTGFDSYTTGDMLYASGASALSKLAIGTANYVLTSSGSAPQWGLLVNANIDAAAAIARSKVASGTADHVLINSGAGALSSEATLAKVRGGTAQDNSSVTFPASGTIPTTTSTSVFTNKDYDGGTASNSSRITVPKETLANLTALTRKEGTIVYATDTDKLYRDDGTSLTEIGSGSGGSINYILNPDAESGTTGWAGYTNAAAATPADGTGSASGNYAISQNTTSPMRGAGNFRITKAAGDQQGKGVSYDFTIARSDQAKVLNISFEYNANDADFVAGDSSDIKIFIYDVTNAVLIPVSPNSIQGSGLTTYHKFTGTFQTSSNSTSYRLIFHQATTNAGAWTFDFDNVVVGPQIQLYGAPISDWTSYTPVGNWTTNATYTGYWRRVGSAMEIFGYVSLGGAPGGTALFTFGIPSGYSIDLTALNSSRQAVGEYHAEDSGTASHGGSLQVNGSNNNVIGCNTANVTATSPFTFGSSDFVTVHFTVPITGWSSTVLMSNDTDTRVVAMRASGDAASASSGNPVIFPTADYDTHGAYSVSTGLYTAPVSGFYRVHGMITSSNAAVAINIAVDGSTVIKGGLTNTVGDGTYTGTVKVVAGQTIAIEPDGTLDSDSSGTLHIERLSGPSAIAATESVIALAESNTARSITNAAATTGEFLMEDVVINTHGAYSASTAIFTVPVSGTYEVQACLFLTSAASWDNNDQLRFQLFKNGSINRAMGGLVSSGTSGVTSGQQISGSTMVKCVAGDTLEVRVFQNSGASKSTDGDANNNWVSYKRIGN